MISITFGSDPDTYFNFDSDIDHCISGSFENNSRTREIHQTGEVLNFFNVDPAGKIVGGCMDFSPYTVMFFDNKIRCYSEERGNFKTKIEQFYPNGTLVIRRSGCYNTCKMVTEITTTDNTMTINTDNGRFLFIDITNFIRYKKNDTEPTLGTGMTTWSQTERNSLFERIF